MTQGATYRQLESNRILGVSNAQWGQVDLQAQLQMTRSDTEGAYRCCFGIEQSIFAAPHTPNFRLLSATRRVNGSWWWLVASCLPKSCARPNTQFGCAEFTSCRWPQGY